MRDGLHKSRGIVVRSHVGFKSGLRQLPIHCVNLIKVLTKMFANAILVSRNMDIYIQTIILGFL